MCFYRCGKPSEQEDEYLDVIGMIVTDIKYKRTVDQKLIYTFSIIQFESLYWTSVKYISNSVEEELNLRKLLQPVGTIVYMNSCSFINEYSLELDFRDEMAVVAIRPNEFQVNNYLKVITSGLPLSYLSGYFL